MQPYDWTTFLRERVYELHPEVPENGFTQGGYKLVYNDTIPPGQTRGGGESAVWDELSDSVGSA